MGEIPSTTAQISSFVSTPERELSTGVDRGIRWPGRWSGTGSRVALLLFATAGVLPMGVHVANADAAYTYRTGFISAVFAPSARNFARFGFLDLGGVPVDNNPPIGGLDAY